MEEVSIHARAQRATVAGSFFFKKEKVSIHARAQRATRSDVLLSWEPAFQSTPARSGRQYRPRTARPRRGFNPRPRAAGDRRVPCRLRAARSFNPRPRAAGDMRSDVLLSWEPVFQSTPARSGRPDLRRVGACMAGFNPRPRAAGDMRTKQPSRCWMSFNPRPRAAGDVPLDAPAGASVVSIHARAQRATGGGAWAKTANLFQSTPARSGRHGVTYNIWTR